MAELIKFCENGIHTVFGIADDGSVSLLWMSLNEPSEDRLSDRRGYRSVQVKTADYGYEDHHGAKHITAGLSERLHYVSHSDTRSADGNQRIFRMVQQADGIYVTSHYIFLMILPLYDRIPQSRTAPKRMSHSNFCPRSIFLAFLGEASAPGTKHATFLSRTIHGSVRHSGTGTP